MRANGDNGVEADAEGVVEIFLAAMFIGHQADIHCLHFFGLERVGKSMSGFLGTPME